MALSTQPYKGTRDFYPEDKRLQKFIFAKLREVVESFGYHEYDAPILEPVDIYLAKSGEEIVNDQLYAFEDKGGRKLAIRPEMTPSVSRMVAAKRQELSYPLRLYSIPNLWRYERPQRGRLREHWQLNVDLFGVPGIEGDHELIIVADAILKAFKAPADSYTIRLSSRKLVEHFLNDMLGLEERQSLDTQKLLDRKHKMPLDEFEASAKEILQKDEHAQQVMAFIHAKSIDDLPTELQKHPSAEEIKRLMKLLRESGVTQAVFDTSIVRGMQYYTDIVFEVFDADPENIRSMFGGGRYDDLLSLFGAEPIPTVGFGMGDVTLQNFLVAHDLVPGLQTETDAIVLPIGEVYEPMQKILAELRQAGLRLAVDSSGRKLDTQLRSAAKSGTRYAIFIGEAELSSKKLKLKDLDKGDEQELTQDQLIKALLAARK